MFETSEVKFNNRRVFFSTGLVLVSAFLFILFLPTLIFVLFGGYKAIFPKEVYSIQSPDNKYILSISKRVGLPIMSPINPSGIINISLKDITNDVINSTKFEIHEYGELTKPTVIWKTGEVQIENIDCHKEFSLKFPLPNN